MALKLKGRDVFSWNRILTLHDSGHKLKDPQICRTFGKVRSISVVGGDNPWAD